MITVWVLRQAEREIERTGSSEEIHGMLRVLQDAGRVPSSWFHAETSSFDAFGPPGSTVRVYYARHANQIVVLGATHAKRGRGRLEPDRKSTYDHRLRDWRQEFPNGRRD